MKRRIAPLLGCHSPTGLHVAAFGSTDPVYRLCTTAMAAVPGIDLQGKIELHLVLAKPRNIEARKVVLTRSAQMWRHDQCTHDRSNVFYTNEHDKELDAMFGSKPGTKVTVWVWITQINQEQP